MLIDELTSKEEIGCGQVVSATEQAIILTTEEKKTVKITPNREQKKDPLFLQILQTIAEAGIWLPFHKDSLTFFDYDWLIPQNRQQTFA